MPTPDTGYLIADFNTLEAIDVSTLEDGSIFAVAQTDGSFNAHIAPAWYLLDKTSSAEADRPWVLEPDAGSGRWIQIGVGTILVLSCDFVEEYSSGYGTTTVPLGTFSWYSTTVPKPRSGSTWRFFNSLGVTSLSPSFGGTIQPDGAVTISTVVFPW